MNEEFIVLSEENIPTTDIKKSFGVKGEKKAKALALTEDIPGKKARLKAKKAVLKGKNPWKTAADFIEKNET